MDAVPRERLDFGVGIHAAARGGDGVDGAGVEARGFQLAGRGAPRGLQAAEVLLKLLDAGAADAGHASEGDPVLTF